MLAVLCGLFLFDTRGSRAVFYFSFLPAALLLFDWRDVKDIWNVPIVRLAALYAAIGISSFFWREQLTLVFFEDFADFINVGMMFVVGVALLAKHPAWINVAFITLGIVAVASFLLALPIYWDALAAGERFRGLSDGRNAIRIGSIFGVAAIGMTFIVAPGTSELRVRLLWYGLAVLAVISVWLTGSRGPLLALAFSFFVGFLLRSPIASLQAVLGTVAIVIVLAMSDFIDPTMLFKRGDSHRLALWQEGLSVAFERPWFGHGFGTIFKLGDEAGIKTAIPHNIIISHMLIGGLFWLGAFIALTGEALREAWRQHRSGHSGYFILLLFSIGCLMTNYHTLVTNLSVEWLIFWTPVAVLAAQQLQNPKYASPDAARMEVQTQYSLK